MKEGQIFSALGLVAAICLLSVSPVSAQDWAKARLNNSPRHADWAEIKSGDRKIKAFVVYPESKDKTPVVLVIQEIFGLTDWLRNLCDELAENGVIAIAPKPLKSAVEPAPSTRPKVVPPAILVTRPVEAETIRTSYVLAM